MLRLFRESLGLSGRKVGLGMKIQSLSASAFYTESPPVCLRSDVSAFNWLSHLSPAGLGYCSKIDFISGDSAFRYTIETVSILVWFRRNVSHPILCTFSSHTQYVKRESIIFSIFQIYAIEYQKQTQTKFSKKELRHFAIYRTSTIIFTVRLIFFGVLRKCYKITVRHSNFDLHGKKV